MQKDRIKAILETIAGFLREQVINPNGEFHFQRASRPLMILVINDNIDYYD